MLADRRTRLALLAPFFTWLVAGMFRLGQILVQHAHHTICEFCLGQGMTNFMSCLECNGAGRVWSLDRQGIEAFSGLRQEMLVLGGVMAVVGLFVYCFTTVDCRACRARGCERCQGRGWLTAVDRWVTEN
jgi:hypothetical protein